MIKTFTQISIICITAMSIFQHLEVVPLFGDMVIPPFSYIKSTPNYDEGKWGGSSSEQGSRQMDLIPKLPQIKAQHDRLLCDIALCPGLSQNHIFQVGGNWGHSIG